jgi:hypothetical protein
VVNSPIFKRRKTKDEEEGGRGGLKQSPPCVNDFWLTYYDDIPRFWRLHTYYSSRLFLEKNKKKKKKKTKVYITSLISGITHRRKSEPVTCGRNGWASTAFWGVCWICIGRYYYLESYCQDQATYISDID